MQVTTFGVGPIPTVGDQVTNQTGYAGGDQANVRGNYIHNDQRKYFGSKPHQDDQGDDEGSADSGSGNGNVAAAGGGFGVVVVLIVVAYFVLGGSDPFPTESDPWPVDVKQEAVVAAVGSWLDKCQQSASATPANCPQSIIETSNVSKVQWTFYGEPLEAPVIRYNDDESRFHVLGTFVVLARYTASEDLRGVVTPMKYWAKVNWADGKLDVQEIKKQSSLGDPDVVKQDPKQPWEPIEAKLKDAFAKCVSGAGSAMPPGCPEWKPPSGATKIKWSAAGDPLLTARASFDSKYGVYRVRGTYGLNVHYTWLGDAESESRNTNYEALIAPTGGGPVVLQIKDAV